MKCNYVAFREQNKRMYLVGERWVRVGEVGEVVGMYLRLESR